VTRQHKVPRRPHHMCAQDVAAIEGFVDVAVDSGADALTESPFGRGIVLRLDGAKPPDCLDHGFEWLTDQVVNPQPASDDVAQSRPLVVAMSASLPAASASVHHCGANWSRTIRPPAASAAAMRACACSYGTKIATWMAPPPSGRGSCMRSNHNPVPRLCGSTRSSSGESIRGMYPSMERQQGITSAGDGQPGKIIR